MEMAVRAAALGLLAVLLYGVLKKESPGFAMVLAMGTAGVILSLSWEALAAILETMQRIASHAGVNAAVSGAMWKTVGIAMVTKLAASLCSDGGQASAAAAVEMAGSAAAVYAALPLLETVLEMLEVLA